MGIGVYRPSGSATLASLGVFGGWDEVLSRLPQNGMVNRERMMEEQVARVGGDKSRQRIGVK
jgi:hypothetical protein